MIPYILAAVLGLLTLGAAMFAWDARKAPPAPPAGVPAAEGLRRPRPPRPAAPPGGRPWVSTPR
jgi:hypothetical protein